MNSFRVPNNVDLLGKDKLLELLHKLDERLKRKMRIVVCGGAAAILKYGIDRRTVDVDVIESSVPVDSIRPVVQEIADEMEIPTNPGNELWFNDHAMRVKVYLAPDYERRLNRISDTFTNLDLRFISKPDLVVMKLAIDTIRERDIDDIAALKLTLQERNIVHEIIDSISKHEPEFARRMEEKFDALQPEAVSGYSSLSGKMDITTLDDLRTYAENIRRFKIPEDFITMWRADLIAGEITIETLKKTVDSLAERYRKNNDDDKTVL